MSSKPSLNANWNRFQNPAGVSRACLKLRRRLDGEA